MSEQFIAPTPKDGEPWDVAIIGSGPASLTAAIYTTRGNASTLVIAGAPWGGQLMLTTEVDNFPGFPEGVQGPDLMLNMRKQAERFGAIMVDDIAAEVNLNVSPREIRVGDTIYKARSIIIATGAETKWLGIPGEDRLRGRGVSSCAPCDAPFFKDKKVAVVGGGDSAMEEALVIAKYASEVTVIHRRDAFKASDIMEQRVLNHPKITVLWNTQVTEIVGDQKVQGIKLVTTDRGEWEKEIDGLFVAIGHKPSTSIVEGKLETNELGYLARTPRDGFSMSTKVDGVFTAGDVHDNHYRQAITAAGFGSMAAIDILHYLDKEAPTW